MRWMLIAENWTPFTLTHSAVKKLADLLFHCNVRLEEEKIVPSHAIYLEGPLNLLVNTHC